MREESIESEVDAAAVKAGYLVRKVQWVGRRGAPDKMYLRDGELIFIEYKKMGKKLEGQQQQEFNRLKRHYSKIFCIDNVAEAKKVLGLS